MIHLELTEPEASLLADIIDIWCEGYAEAKADTEVDPTFETAEEFLVITDGLQAQQQMALDMRSRLKQATFHG